jgi:hypothetical protein
MTGSIATLPGERLDDSIPDHMTSSIITTSSVFAGTSEDGRHGASAESEEEDEHPNHFVSEKTITLVGNVKGKIVLIIDDMIDKPATWVAAAETVVKRGGATKVYCVATHGLFGDDSLEALEACACIDYVRIRSSSLSCLFISLLTISRSSSRTPSRFRWKRRDGQRSSLYSTSHISFRKLLGGITTVCLFSQSSVSLPVSPPSFDHPLTVTIPTGESISQLFQYYND